MARVIKVAANRQMLEDLEKLKEALGANTNAEALRRVLAAHVLLQKELEKHGTIRIKGKGKADDTADLILA